MKLWRKHPLTPKSPVFILEQDGDTIVSRDILEICEENSQLRERRDKAVAELNRMREIINRPHIGMWTEEVIFEAAHQRERWPSESDATKKPTDWFWLVGYLAGKALAAHMAGDTDKLRHHTVSTGAVLAHWAAYAKGDETVFSPGTTPTELGERHEATPGRGVRR